MDNKGKYIKIFKLVLLFIFFLVWNLFINRLNLDEIWNYGFAHSLYKGLIPYRDFNMVLTPLYPFIMSIFFHIFGSNILVLHVVQCIIIVMTFYILNKLLGSKSYIFILLLCFPLSITYPSYNFFLLFLSLLIILCEKDNKNDYLIGFLLACIILTKHTVGTIMLLPSFYYLKVDYKKILKRFSIVIIFMFLFLIYLILSNSLLNFIDICILGLIDFSGNSKGINLFLILTILLLGIVCCLIKKDKKNILNYYALAFSSILIPIFDLYHFELFFIMFLVVFLLQKKLALKINIKLFAIGVLLGISVLLLKDRSFSKIKYPNKINHFEYKLLDNKYIDYTNKINKKIDKYGIKNIIFLSADAHYFKIVNDKNINKYDLINKGNLGYNGDKRLLNDIKTSKDKVFFVDKSELGLNKQSSKPALNYVIKNGKKIDKVYKYDIYILKGSD